MYIFKPPTAGFLYPPPPFLYPPFNLSRAGGVGMYKIWPCKTDYRLDICLWTHSYFGIIRCELLQAFGPAVQIGNNSWRVDICKASRKYSHLFLRILFFHVLPRPPRPSPTKSPLSWTSDLLFLVEKRWPVGAGFWGRFWTGVRAQEKKENPFFLRTKKRRVFLGNNSVVTWGTMV